MGESLGTIAFIPFRDDSWSSIDIEANLHVHQRYKDGRFGSWLVR
jgi:hypothetical protein